MSVPLPKNVSFPYVALTLAGIEALHKGGKLYSFFVCLTIKFLPLIMFCVKSHDHVQYSIHMNDGGNILRSLINMLNVETFLSIKLVLLIILFIVQLRIYNYFDISHNFKTFAIF